MHKGIFITGTDTGVGKTFVAAGLIKAFRESGFNVCPMKPVETGCRMKRGKCVPGDTLKLVKASGVHEASDVINPYRFKQPLAPSVAAELENVTLKKRKILKAFNYLFSKYDVTIIEGAGGIMVPVYKNYFFLDLIKDMNVPLLIVSRPGLGTINHTLLTIKAAKSRGINILGVIINYATKISKGLPEKTNPEIIEKLGRVAVLGIIAYSEHTKKLRVKKIFSEIIENIMPRL
jgi:dethiobiotin synthetase